MRNLVLSLLIIIPIVVSGQDFNKIYFNKHWVGTSIDNAVFYRISGFNDTIPAYDGKTVDSYFGTDNIQMVGYYEKLLLPGRSKEKPSIVRQKAFQ